MWTWLWPILLDMLGTSVRYALFGLSQWLVEHHMATHAQGEAFVNGAVAHLGIITPAVIAVGWSAARNIWNRRAVLTALWMHKGSTEDDLKAQLKTGVTPTVQTPPDTIPGVPKGPTV